MQGAEQEGDIPSFMMVVKLHEGYVLNVQGYAIAVTSAADLASRVGQFAERSEVGFQAPQPEHDITDTIQVRQGPPPAMTPQEAQETAAVLQATHQGDTATQGDLETEWRNVRQMMAFLAAGYDKNGKAFTRKEWDAALPIFAPHVDPKEAEFELSEFLSALQEED